MPRIGEIPSLDGLRALAVALVFASHLDPAIGRLVPGGLGVTIFFVLSGYLITTLLRIEWAQQGNLSFLRFYLRRALRLFPPLYLVVALAAGAVALGWIEGRNSPEGLAAVLFYWANYHIAAHDFDGLPKGLGIAWSLAIEEHFYLVWPLLFALLGHCRCRPRIWVVVIGALCLLPLLLRLVLATNGLASGLYIEHATETRFDGLMWGCLLAVVCNPWLDEPTPRQPLLEALLLAGGLLLLALSLLYRDALFRATLRHSLQAVALLPLFWLAIARAEQWPFRVLNQPVLRHVGQISYGIYLSHHLVILGLASNFPSWPLAQRALVAMLVVWGFCELLRRGIEQPLGRWRKNLQRSAPQAAP